MEKVNVMDRITAHPDVMVGKPTIRKMRITVEQLLKALANGITKQRINSSMTIRSWKKRTSGQLFSMHHNW